MDFYIVSNVVVICSALMIVVFAVQKVLLKKFFQTNAIKVALKSSKKNIAKTILFAAFLTSLSSVHAAESQGFFDRAIDSVKSFFERINPFSSSSKVAEGEKRLEHYDASKNEKLEIKVNGPAASKDSKKSHDYGKVIESEEFIGEAYPEIASAAKEAAPSAPKDEEEISKIKQELAKEESKEDLQRKTYTDIENETIASDQKREDETKYEQEAAKEISNKMETTGKQVISEAPEANPTGKAVEAKK
jgi:hypothetical protein